MKIFMPIWGDSPDKLSNPFISTLVDGIKELSRDITFYYESDFLFSDECESIDIIHIMWPHVFFANHKTLSANVISSRLKYLKSKGIKLVCTCHNYVPHYTSNEQRIKAYKYVYENSDLIIHLGGRSLQEFKEQYPEIHHILIPHHVYDRLYDMIPSKKESLKKLHLSASCHYIMCLGTFRSDEERLLLWKIGKSLRFSNIYIIAPNFTTENFSDNSFLLRLKLRLNKAKLKYLFHIISNGCYVCDEDLPYYYSVSDISLIQRQKILNSGNVPMGLYFGNVVVGPNVGNVGELLKETHNVVFNPSGNDILNAIVEALTLSKTKQGENNRKYAMKHFSTERIARLYVNAYMKLENNIF